MEELKCFVNDIFVSVLIPYPVLGIDDPLINPIPQNGQLHYAPAHHLGDHDVFNFIPVSDERRTPFSSTAQ
jgi:hypothetical protein